MDIDQDNEADDNSTEDTLEYLGCDENSDTCSLNNFSMSDSFLCGVIEGFYGIPWTYSQRCDLMNCISKSKMNTYVYAPKDDEKHRKYWRKLYNNSECESLKALINYANECNINFVYSLSPGLDIIFSSLDDRNAFKWKLEQVQNLGCKNFAIYFDDIDPELCGEDLLKYSNSASAQAEISNYIYQFLNYPQIFLFCPTEYCSSRAKPSVVESVYLKTLAAELHQNIKIMWTGPRVVSKAISLENIISINNVLQRRPLIWDNLHANDYDKHQIFLGPYEGRSLSLYPYLSGVFTNPNCQYDLNFVPIHSFSMWVSEARLRYKECIIDGRFNYEIANNIEITKEFDTESSLIKCSKLWCEKFSVRHEDTMKISSNSEQLEVSPGVSVNEFLFYASDCLNADASNLYMNESKEVVKNGSPITPSPVLDNTLHVMPTESKVNYQDIYKIINFCYLPSKMGALAKNILNEFLWIKSTSSNYWRCNPIDCALRYRLIHKRPAFRRRCSQMITAIKKVLNTSNTTLKFLLAPFLTEIKESLSALCSYVHYLELREETSHYDGVITEPDSWIIKSRFSLEVHKLLPSLLYEECFNEIQGPSFVYVIRPHIESDLERVEEICYQHMINSFGSWDNVKPSKHLVRLRYLETFFQTNFEMMVIEDNEGLNGYLIHTHSSNSKIEESIKQEYEKSLVEEFSCRNAEHLLCYDLSYQPFVETICLNLSLRIFMCFQPNFKKSQVLLKLVELVIEKIKVNNLNGAYIILDKYQFIDATSLKKIGFKSHPDGKTENHEYFYFPAFNLD